VSIIQANFAPPCDLGEYPICMIGHNINHIAINTKEKVNPVSGSPMKTIGIATIDANNAHEAHNITIDISECFMVSP